jgi:hypothetical protein
MRTIFILTAFCIATVAAHAQLATTFTISSNDVVQRSIMVGHSGDTNDTRVAVRFTFTAAGARRLEEFYRAHTVGDDVRFQCGSFVYPFKIDDRKTFTREGIWGLSQQEAKAYIAGLRGQR